MTHREHCVKARNWLVTHGYPLAFDELSPWACPEHPDAIGWNWKGHSCLIEVKISKADFLNDKTKKFRKRGGVGMKRYYLTPKGLVDPVELPAGWGLIEIYPSGRCRLKTNSATFKPNEKREIILLVSAARGRLNCDYN